MREKGTILFPSIEIVLPKTKATMPHVLELCCGWKSFSEVLVRDHGWTADTLDVLPKFRPTLTCDVTQ